MLRAGTIRRVRQTLLATNLAEGALVAWKVPEDKIDAAFDWMFQRDPFSGHVVLRSTDTVTAGSDYKLWTTVKVPQGFSLEAHCELLAKKVGAERFRLMPAKGIFTLGVGHVRRKTIEPGSKADQPAKMIPVQMCRAERTRMECLARAEARIYSGRNQAVAVGCAREGSRRITGGILSRGRRIERAKDHWAFFNFSRARQTIGGRCAGDAVQRALSLGGAARSRN